MMLLQVVILALAAAVQLTQARPYEVPNTACVDMTPKGPGHNFTTAQNSKMPFDLLVQKTSIRSSDPVEFTIRQKPNGPPFIGFMVQARQDGPTPIGTFTPKTDNMKTVTCTNEGDTASHLNPEPKESVTMVWTPPPKFKGPFKFYATVAETKYKFWTAKKSATVTVK